MRFVPAAVTPIQSSYILQAFKKHLANEGCNEFEKEISSYLGVDKAFAFTSFMRAIYASLLSLKKIDNRKEVILPRYSCPSFAHAILSAGLRIKYCDTDFETLGLDINSIKKMDLKDVLALICINQFGLSNPMDDISDFCKKNNIYLIEDLGYSIGTEYGNKKLGTFGDFSVLNFQEGKSIPIGGGMVTTSTNIMDYLDDNRPKSRSDLITIMGYKFFAKPSNYAIFMKISQLLNLNLRKKVSMEDTIRSTSHEFDFDFDFKNSLNSISNFQGALGVLILKNFEKNIKSRLSNAMFLEKKLKDYNNIQIIKKDDLINKIHYIRYPILVKNNKRDSVLDHLLKSGVEASSMYAEHGMSIDQSKFPGSKLIYNELLTLPCHPYVNQNDLNLITKSIEEIVN